MLFGLVESQSAALPFRDDHHSGGDIVSHAMRLFGSWAIRSRSTPSIRAARRWRTALLSSSRKA